MAQLHTVMALEESVAGDASPTSSGVDAGHSDHVNIDIMLPITGTGHGFAGEQGTTTILYGVSTLWRTSRSYRKWNVMQACIFLMALSGAVLGTQHLITKMRASYSFSSGHEDGHHSHMMPQLVSHVVTSSPPPSPITPPLSIFKSPPPTPMPPSPLTPNSQPPGKSRLSRFFASFLGVSAIMASIASTVLGGISALCMMCCKMQ